MSFSETNGPAPDRTARPMCVRCERPVSVCYCAGLTELETRSRIVILQHPREQGMPIGTARMAHLCLPRSSLHVGTEWDDSDVLREACGDPERPPILLYPGEGARDILEDPPSAPVTLIVVDGTWSQARTLVRDNPSLAQIPRYAFRAPEPSHYRIRREPHDEYVSTIEALMHVLGAIEGDAERFRPLLRPMKMMVDAQIDAKAAAPRPRSPRARIRRTPHERLPVEVRERYADLVLVVAEANAWPHHAPERQLGDELIYFVAHRPSTRESFSFVVAPQKPLSPDIPHHTEIPEARLRAGGSAAALLDAFEAFIRPNDVVGAWGHHALRLLQGCGGAVPGSFLDMQEAARLLTNRKSGSLEGHVSGSSAAPIDGLPPWRAGRRLGLLTRILDDWHALPRPAREGQFNDRCV